MRRFSGLLMWLILVGGLVGVSIYVMTDKHPKRLGDGLASASNEEMQHQPCLGHAPDDAYTFYLGDAAVWFRDLPHTVVSMGGAPLLVVKRAANDAIAVELALDDGSRQLGRLDGVTLASNPGGLRIARPNGSELQIFAADGSLIAQLDRTAPRALRLTGHLTFGGQDFVLGQDNFVQNGDPRGAVCLGGDKSVDFAL